MLSLEPRSFLVLVALGACFAGGCSHGGSAPDETPPVEPQVRATSPAAEPVQESVADAPVPAPSPPPPSTAGIERGRARTAQDLDPIDPRTPTGPIDTSGASDATKIEGGGLYSRPELPAGWSWWSLRATHSGVLEVAVSRAGLVLVAVLRDGVEVGRGQLGRQPDRGEGVGQFAGRLLLPTDGPADWRIGIRVDAPRRAGLLINFDGDTPQVDSVSPPSARPGDVVTVEGSHFSDSVEATWLVLGTVRHEVLATQPDRLQFRLGQDAVSGELVVMIGGRRSAPHRFDLLGEHPQPPRDCGDPDRIPHGAGGELDLERVTVILGAGYGPDVARRLAASEGGRVCGWLRHINGFQIEVPGARDLGALEGAAARLRKDPAVRRVSFSITPGPDVDG